MVLEMNEINSKPNLICSTTCGLIARLKFGFSKFVNFPEIMDKVSKITFWVNFYEIYTEKHVKMTLEMHAINSKPNLICATTCGLIARLKFGFSKFAHFPEIMDKFSKMTFWTNFCEKYTEKPVRMVLEIYEINYKPNLI